MSILRNLILFFCVLSIFACSSLPGLDEVLPDKRKTYQKSKDLPALEVPPDLTVTKGDYAATIPSDEQANTLSEFERQRAAGTRKLIGGAVLGGGQAAGEQWLALRGKAADVWPQLTKFWQDKGYMLDLNDLELGVMETDWKEEKGEKHRFKLFVEPGESGDTIVFLSSEKQALLEGAWLEAAPDADMEKKMIRKISLHFYGTEFENTTTTANHLSSSSKPKSIRPKAQILSLDEGKTYLAVPQKYKDAWRETEMVLQRAGYTIQDKSEEKGIYHFLYFKPKEEQGLLSKLKFWSHDEGTPYQLSLIGVGDKTEIMVINKEGEAETGEEVDKILSNLKELYNQL